MVTQAKKIAEVISAHQKFQYKYNNDESGQKVALRNVEASIDEYLKKYPGQALQFILPGFPFKFPIRTIFGYKPKQKQVIDAADYFALLQLEKFVREVRKVYEPGMIIDILMDSEGFKELEGISDETIALYRGKLEHIINKLQLSENIQLVRFSDLNPNEDFSHYQQRISPTLEIYVKNSRATNEADFLKRYIGVYEYQRKQARQLLTMKDEYLSDILLQRKENLDNRIKKTVKDAAYQHLRHQDTWRHIVSENFPDHLRLTIHPQSPDSDKIGIYLSDKSNIFAPVPWQGVPVRVISDAQAHTDIIIDYGEILRLDNAVPLHHIQFDRISCSLPCFIIDNTSSNEAPKVNIYKLMMDNLYLNRTKGLFAFENNISIP